MIRLPPRNEMHPLRLPSLEEELPRELHRPVVRFAPAPHKERFAQPARSVAYKEVRKIFRCAGCVGEGVHVCDRERLRCHRSNHFFVPVADYGDRRSAAGVEDAGAILQGEVVFVGACYEDWLFVEGAVEERGCGLCGPVCFVARGYCSVGGF
jgi:hypothetical protein